MNLHKVWFGCKRLICGNVCGLSAKEGTIVAGLFTLVTSTLHLIFESGNLRMYKLTNHTAITSDDKLSFHLTLHQFSLTSISLVTVGIFAVFALFLSVWKEVYWGIAGYIVWIVFFELGQVFLLIFFMPKHENFPMNINAMESTGMALRCMVEAYWIIFLTRYTLELYRFQQRVDDSVKVKQKASQRLKFGSVVEMGV
ncbi:transmembrane protein 217-like [Leucoraja erinacea]|uniref:transmembrane protein 217-like n=1 Tax=Leucoraja erinaceus TaxID=7782 RepID=UPI002453C499|nr:transmembrane protein 217-like [Leucoraja erinacea]XP_055486947.1 transmembrane protein 217-like [Leucoraja erinacea]